MTFKIYFLLSTMVLKLSLLKCDQSVSEDLVWNGLSFKSLTSQENVIIANDEEPEAVEERPRLSNKEIYANLKKRLSSIKQSCGEVCETNIGGIDGKYYKAIKKEVNCEDLFSNADIDANAEFKSPPAKIPKYLLPDFTYNGQLEIQEYYRDDASGVSHFTHWTDDLFQNIQAQYEENDLMGPYGASTVQNIVRHIDEHMQVQDKHILVIGSQTPWIETILLNKGAKNITTFDYVKIKSDHPQVEVLTPAELSEMYLQKKVQFDTMITFSSLEHSGLGRYGDMLNPWGDLITMARAWCLVKPGGKALVGVPSGPDTIIFNSHRLYGPIAYSNLFANWKQVYTENDFSEFNKYGCDHCYQPLHVVERA